MVSKAKSVRDEAEDDDGTTVSCNPTRVERLLANLGYGKRKECQAMVKKGVVRYVDGSKVKIGEKVQHNDILVAGEPLDGAYPLTIILNKPVGYVVTSPDDERVLDPTVYDLLPYR
jgi:16S rRNA pseudouridine516 synthase